MTRKSEGATAGLRRGRTLATAGLGAATLIGGLVYAMPANAAGTVTASLTPASSSVINDGTSHDALTIKVNNGTTTALTGNVGYRFVLTVPNDSTCAGVTLTADAADATAPAITQVAGTCQFTTAQTQTVAAGGSTSDIYDLAVTSGSGATGTINISATVVQNGAGDLATASATVQLVGPGSANFKKVPSAIIKQNYTQSLYTPPTGGATTTTVYKATSNTTAGGVTTTCWVPDTSTTTVGTTTYTDLNDTLELDEATGTIISNPVNVSGTNKARPVYGPNGGTDSNPAAYIVVVNNGTGGASAAVAGTACSDPAIVGGFATIPVAVHDVSSGSFQIPVAFIDVPLDGTFAKQIYSLGDAGTITGYADGSFQPATAISRQAMAALLEPGPGSDTSCVNWGVDSPYTDVPATSQFCAAIYEASNDGLFNGYAGGTFHPTANISRQAISAVLFRKYTLDRLGSTNGDAACTTPVPFKDVSAQSPFCGDIEWMKTNGLSNGYNGGTEFHPTANSSRQATAAFLYALEQLENA